jgi:hypothetical protein
MDPERKDLMDTIYARQDGYSAMADLAWDMMELVPLDALRAYKEVRDDPEDAD